MKVGETKTVRLEPDEAYGPRRDDLLITVPTNQAPDGLEVGQEVLLDNNIPALVVDVNEDEVTIDANHHLAGEALTFEIEVVGIE
jgi:FKBP-type peptidyl-prolyl cis-trans isomerase 2